MKPTIAAILARFNQDRSQAFAYCHRMANMSTNPHFRQEYREIAKTIWREAGWEKAEAAHV
jgi:hypothetical protein